MIPDEELTKFIEAYGDALRQGPRAIAEFHAEPCVTAQPGAVRVHQTRHEIAALLAEIDAAHRARGFTYADVLDMNVHALGPDSAIAIVQWAYKGACAELLWKSTSAYNLHRCHGVWQIVVATDRVIE